jgi:hypothetical protein
MTREQYSAANSVEFMADRLCQSGLVDRLIISSSRESGWIDRICDLGGQEKLELVNIIYSHLDPSKARSQVRYCIHSDVIVVHCSLLVWVITVTQTG